MSLHTRTHNPATLAAHAQEAAANVEQMAAIVKERAKDVDMTKRRIVALEERCQVNAARARRGLLGFSVVTVV